MVRTFGIPLGAGVGEGVCLETLTTETYVFAEWNVVTCLLTPIVLFLSISLMWLTLSQALPKSKAQASTSLQWSSSAATSDISLSGWVSQLFLAQHSCCSGVFSLANPMRWLVIMCFITLLAMQVERICFQAYADFPFLNTEIAVTFLVVWHSTSFQRICCWEVWQQYRRFPLVHWYHGARWLCVDWSLGAAGGLLPCGSLFRH